MLLSHVWLFVTPLTVAHQVPLSLKFSRQEYWSRVSFPSPGDLSNPGIELLSPALAGRLFMVWATREALSPSVLLSKVPSWAEISISSSKLACDIRHFDGKNPPAMQETQIWSLHQEDPLEKVMTFHSSIIAWRIPWTEEPGGLQSMGCKNQIWLLITHTHTVAIGDAEDFCSCAALAKSTLKRDYMMDCGDIIYVACHFEMCSVIIIYFSTQNSM